MEDESEFSLRQTRDGLFTIWWDGHVEHDQTRDQCRDAFESYLGQRWIAPPPPPPPLLPGEPGYEQQEASRARMMKMVSWMIDNDPYQHLIDGSSYLADNKQP